MKTNFQKVREFHEVFSRNKKPTKPSVTHLTDEQIALRFKLIDEEISELFNEFYRFDEELLTYNPRAALNIADIAKELADVLYVTYGFFDEIGVDADEVFRRVHESNMSKLDKDGNVLRRADGKILKSDQYKPAQINVKEIGIDKE